MVVGVWYLSYSLRGGSTVYIYTIWKEAGHVRPPSKTPRTASHGFNGRSWEGAIWQQFRCVTSDDETEVQKWKLVEEERLGS